MYSWCVLWQEWIMKRGQVSGAEYVVLGMDSTKSNPPPQATGRMLASEISFQKKGRIPIGAVNLEKPDLPVEYQDDVDHVFLFVGTK